MSNFMDGIKSTLNNECNVSVTENGAVGFRTTGKALLDLNFAVASLRSATTGATYSGNSFARGTMQARNSGSHGHHEQGRRHGDFCR